MSRPILVVLTILSVTLSPQLTGATLLHRPQALAARVAEVRDANDGALKDYTWHNRTEIKKEGGRRVAIPTRIAFDDDGEIEATTVEVYPPKRKRGVGLRSRVWRNTMGLAGEMSAEITDLVDDYTSPSLKAMQEFFDRAAIDNAWGGTWIRGRNFLQRGDYVSIFIDPETYRFTHLSFVTTVGDVEVKGEVDFSRLDTGVWYPARMVIKAPNEGVEAVIENFDHQKNTN